MRSIILRSTIIIFALCLIAVSAVQASELTFQFPTVGAYYFSATNGSGFITTYGQIAPMWTAGDFITQTFFNGPDVADSFAFDFLVKDYLTDSNQEVANLYINGALVAVLTVDGVTVPTVFHFQGVFPISPSIDGAGTYNYSWVLQNTIPPGGGSIAFYATPEPSSIVLLGSGMLGLVGVLRRKFIG